MNRNITALILIVLAAGIYFTITEGMISEVRTVQAENDQYLAAIDKAKELIGKREKVYDAWNSIPQLDRERLVKMVPNSVDNIRLIIDLTDVARQHGFALQNIKAAASTPTPTPGAAAAPAAVPQAAENPNTIAVPTPDSVTVSFSVTAPYLQFISFMKDLEANLRLMDVTHLSMTATDTGIYTFNVQLKTYWLREQ